MFVFVCALGDFLVLSASVLRQIARYLPHHRSENASKTHSKSSHDKFKTASKSSFKFSNKVIFYQVLLRLFPVCFPDFIRQIARYLPHHRSENASKTHPKSSHDKFKTASKTRKIFCRIMFKYWLETNYNQLLIGILILLLMGNITGIVINVQDRHKQKEKIIQLQQEIDSIYHEIEK
ncbi:hypothetical protein B5F25_12865 [Bacteroides sp. An19]|nr:hypothetical protein B5F25_12865 [Bacteroides sp. An19]